MIGIGVGEGIEEKKHFDSFKVMWYEYQRSWSLATQFHFPYQDFETGHALHDCKNPGVCQNLDI